MLLRPRQVTADAASDKGEDRRRRHETDGQEPNRLKQNMKRAMSALANLPQWIDHQLAD